MKLLLLYLLATVDSACSGYRASAGKNALIFKKAYYLQALRRGALIGQLPLALAAVAYGIWRAVSTDPARLAADVEALTTPLVAIYGAYAVVLVLAGLARLLPSVDTQSITSVMIFGPLTFLRPPVAVLGFVVSASLTGTWRLAAVGGPLIASLLLMEVLQTRLFVLNRETRHSR